MAQCELHENQLTIDAHPDKAQYKPGEKVVIVVTIQNNLEKDIRGKLEIRFLYLFTQIAVLTQEVTLKARSKERFAFVWLPLSDKHLRGYGVDIQFIDHRGQSLAETSTAFDVAPDWTFSPRYGFLCDFAPNEGDTAERLSTMNKFHINVIQFYDWLYRHDTLLPPNEEFLDPLGRQLSLKTLQNKITLAHQYNMAAMAYTSVYGASIEFYVQHKDWALYRADGRAWTFGGGFLYIMNPAEGSQWRKHLLKQFQAALEDLKFDGIHIDQYGDPKFAFDKEKKPVDLASAFASFINETKEALCREKPDIKVVFNAVNNWPIRAVAPANQDIIYVEVWPPHDTYQDLAAIIRQGRQLSGGKKVVLAAYVPPAWEASVRLTDAVIFANGGFHIEIGELNGMLSDPYFPKYKPMSPQLVEIMRGYYDFLVRYGNVLHDSVEDTEEFLLFLDNIRVRDRAEPDTIWAIVKRKENLLIVNLINLLGVNCLWRAKQEAPRVLKDVHAKLLLPASKQVTSVYLASPDFDYGRLKALKFKRSSKGIEFTIPRLEYWDLLLFVLE